MNEKELLHLLKQVKDTPVFGGDFQRSKMEEGWKHLAEQLSFKQTTLPSAPVLSWKDFFSYIEKTIFRTFLRPVSIGASLFSLVFMGWIATVNASFSSVPGDFLYPVKLATERVQLTLAITNNEQRARLHAEFASRRLEEVMDIAGSNRTAKDVRMHEAVAGFKQEIASVNEEFVQATTGNVQEAFEMAKVVDRKVGEYEAVFARNEENPSLNEHRIEVDAARQIVEETKQQVTDAIVTTHEATPEPATTVYLQSTFQRDLGEIRTTMNSYYGRITVIEQVLNTQTLDNEEKYRTDAESFKRSLQNFESSLTEAMDFFAAGGFRRVSEMVSQLKGDLTSMGSAIQTMEIEISTKVSL
jgi:hypothetical protein